MIKKLFAIGALAAGFAGLGLATPAQASPWPVNTNEYNIASQNDNLAVCGNRAIDDIIVGLLPIASPITASDKEPVDCSVRAYQNN